jgi:hypothetical protein
MQPPADLREGWYWVRWADGQTSILALRYSTVFRCWMCDTLGKKLDLVISDITALEPVAPPSWSPGPVHAATEPEPSGGAR